MDEINVKDLIRHLLTWVLIKSTKLSGSGKITWNLILSPITLHTSVIKRIQISFECSVA